MRTYTVCAALALTALASAVAAQAPAPAAGTGQRLTFEVASIKRNVSGDANSSVRGQPGGRLVVTNNSLYNLIRNAYNTQRFEMVPGAKLPSWIDSDRWDINAKGSETATQPEVMQMLQNLLAERFKLVARRETREMPIYALVLARSDGRLGPQLRRSDVDCAAVAAAVKAGGAPPPPPAGGGPFCGTRANASGGVAHIEMHGMPLENFVRNLSAQAGRVIVDKTGLTGAFEFQLTFTPDQAPPGSTPSDNASLFAAIQEQLGLKLEPQRGPVNVLVIESAEKPTED
ncbi:MAG TPA: TIGR03435 family protein [Vicinamibacterales bacterium]|nr:TIGR03435 family protein [Vicinamibacterales bacterium]